MINIGDAAPQFELADQAGGRLSLAALLEQGDVIVYFYPADFTPLCTAEACAFRDIYEDLAECDIQLVGISPQTEDSHQRFGTQFSLQFPLLFDESKNVIRAYGVDGPLGFGVRRATFLIGRDGIVRHRVVSDFFVSSHMNMVRKILDAL